MAKPKSLTKEQNSNVKRLLREILDRDFTDPYTHKVNQSEAARALGVSQATVSAVAASDPERPTKGAGMGLANALATYAGVSVGEVLSGTGTPRPHRTASELDKAVEFLRGGSRGLSSEFLNRVQGCPPPEVQEDDDREILVLKLRKLHDKWQSERGNKSSA